MDRVNVLQGRDVLTMFYVAIDVACAMSAGDRVQSLVSCVLMKRVTKEFFLFFVSLFLDRSVCWR